MSYGVKSGSPCIPTQNTLQLPKTIKYSSKIIMLGMSSKSETSVLRWVRVWTESCVEMVCGNLRVRRSEGIDRLGTVFVSACRQLGMSSVRPVSTKKIHHNKHCSWYHLQVTYPSNVHSQTDTDSDQCEEKLTPKQIWRFADNHKSYQSLASNRDLQINAVHSKFNFLPSLAIDITARWYLRTGLKRHLIISCV